MAIDDIACDSRRVTAGCLFACVPGLTVDGHEFAAEAVARGAGALLVERELPLDTPQLVVSDARAACGLAADAIFGEPTRALAVAGVTGTNGKTTTAFLVFAILAAAGRRPALLGTIERRIGGERRTAVRTTAEAVDLQRDFREMLDAGDRSCAMEVSSHASALGRLVGTRFAALAFTNLSQDHLDFHGDLERYFQAKLRAFVEPDVDGRRPPAAVNVGDAYGRRVVDELRRRGEEPLTFAVDAPADLVPAGLVLTAAGARFRLGALELETALVGRFNVENVLAAVAVSRLLGVDDDAIARGVAHVRGVPGRLEPVDAGQDFSVLVDYAHTPDALERVLGALRDVTAGRLVCVFGCGGDRDRAKRPLMGEVAARLADRVIVTSDNPRSEDPETIVASIVEGSQRQVEVEIDRRLAIERALAGARSGDVVLLAGKGHEQGQEANGEIRPFDDREVAAELLRSAQARNA